MPTLSSSFSLFHQVQRACWEGCRCIFCPKRTEILFYRQLFCPDPGILSERLCHARVHEFASIEGCFVQAFTSFSLPSSDEGLNEVRYEWRPGDESAELLKNWKSSRNLTICVEDHCVVCTGRGFKFCLSVSDGLSLCLSASLSASLSLSFC